MTETSRLPRVRWIIGLSVIALAVIAAPWLPPDGAAHAVNFTPNVFGQLRSAQDGLPTSIGAVTIYRVSATGSPSTLVRTPIASSTGDDSVTFSDDTFSAYVDFAQGFTYEMDVTPASESAGAITTFRLPGPAGNPTTLMHFRLELHNEVPGLYAKVRQWACRADSENNCVAGFRVRTTAGPGAWTTVDDSATYPTYDCDPNQNPTCGVDASGPSAGQYNWDKYETWNVPTTGGNPAQQVRVQWVYRPMEMPNNAPPDPSVYPYPYMTIEVYSQGEGFTRDGWGCTVAGDNNTWWSPDDTWSDPAYAYPIWFDDVMATYGCGGGVPIDSDLDYELALRSAESTFIPLFTAGYLTGMSTDLAKDDSSYTMTISGAPRPWQWLGGAGWRNLPEASDDSENYRNYYDATNLDWSFSTYDGRIVASENPSIEPCIGNGMAASSTNGNGGAIPRWDYETQSLDYNTFGRHFMPSNIDDSGNPTASTSAGTVYIGEAEMYIPTPLALCMWADAGFDSVADLQSMAGQVRSEAGGLKAGSVVNLTVDDTAMYVTASGYTYSRAALVVAPEVGIMPLGRDVGAVTIGDEAYQEFYVRNNDDSDPFTFGAAPSVSGQNASDFAIVDTVNECFVDVVSLAPGEECSIAFRFAPTAPGVRQAMLNFTTSPTLNGPHSMVVQGTGVALPPSPTPIAAGAPTSVVASPGKASATVSWRPPTSTGSFAVTSYEVKSSPGGITCISTATECVVTGLTNGTSYTFVVRALTGAGWGEYSSPSNAVVPRGDDPAPVTKSILVTGSREGRIAKVVGQSTGLSDTSVTPFVRLRGAATFTQGARTRPIDTDGAFTWQRSTGKQLSVYFTGSGAKSNTVTIKAR